MLLLFHLPQYTATRVVPSDMNKKLASFNLEHTVIFIFIKTPVSWKILRFRPLEEERKSREGIISTMGTNSLKQPVACLQTLISSRDHDIQPLETGLRIVVLCGGTE